MRAGGLRTPLTILTPPTARNGANEVVGANDPTKWTAAGTTWGQVSPASGALLDLAQAYGAGANVSVSVVVRYNPNIKVTNRLSYAQPDGSTRFLTIQAVLDKDNRHQMLTLLCSTKG